MQENLVDPRSIFISSIDLSSSRVELSTSPIVLLCGGPVPIKDRPEDPDIPAKSLRDCISRAGASFEIFRPEEIQSWHQDGIFKNLMDFEEHLTSICSLVVIILESAGSLVELGAFSQLEDLNKKLIVIRSSKFDDEISFINLGILRYLSEIHHSAVKSYPWDIEDPSGISPQLVQDIIFDLSDELSQQGKTHVFKPETLGHVLVLICELIAVCGALKEGEILEYLRRLEIEIGREPLRSSLFLLSQFRLIEKQTYSDSVFYLRTQESFHRLRVSLTTGVFDSVRIKSECMEFYRRDPKQRHRLRILRKEGAQ